MHRKSCRAVMIVAVIGAASLTFSLDNGLALTPPMGWNPWSEFKWNIKEADFRAIADSMVSKGLQRAGYIYMNQDGGGTYANNKALGDWLHGKGFKFGMYGNNVNYSITEAAWVTKWVAAGADYIKWDAYNSSWNNTTYATMRDALAASGRQIVYSAHWGDHTVSASTCNTANLWRTTPDIYIPWESPQDAWNKIVNYIGMNNNSAAYAKPGAWNDPDFLLVGLTDGWTDPNVVGFTYDENKTHFSLWCISAAPLIIGTDVRDLKASSLEVLTNAEVIAIDQDSLGYQGRRIRRNSTDNTEVWSKNLRNGDKAVLLVNFSTAAKRVSVRWSEVGLSGAVAVRDLWQHTDLGLVSDSLVVTSIPLHGCAMFRLTGSSVGVEFRIESRTSGGSERRGWTAVHPFSQSMAVAPLFDIQGRQIGRSFLPSVLDAVPGASVVGFGGRCVK